MALVRLRLNGIWGIVLWMENRSSDELDPGRSSGLWLDAHLLYCELLINLKQF